MHTRAVRIKRLGLVTIRPLGGRDTATVEALRGRLGVEASALNPHVVVDSQHHTLVAHVEGDAEPAGIAQLVRDADEWNNAETAFAVADCYHGSGVVEALAQCLAADARAAGITHLSTAQSSDSAARSLIRKVSSSGESRFQGNEVTVVATLDAA